MDWEALQAISEALGVIAVPVLLLNGSSIPAITSMSLCSG